MEQNNFQTRRQEAGLIDSIHSGGAAAAGGLIPASGGFIGAASSLVPAGGFIGAAGGFLPAGYTLGGSASGHAGGGAYAATSVAAAATTTTTGGVGGCVGAAGGFHAAGYSPEGSAAGPAGGGYTGYTPAAAAIGGVVVAGSGGDGAAGPSFHKKRNRHTQQQVSALETFLKDFPYPREVQINDLARRLEMDPTQVRYWIQNKRTQMKCQSKLEENEALRCENFVLQTEIQRLTEVLSKNICPRCGVSHSQQIMEENNLRSENIRLREEMEHLQLALINHMDYEDQQNLPGILQPHNIADTQDK